MQGDPGSFSRVMLWGWWNNNGDSIEQKHKVAKNNAWKRALEKKDKYETRIDQVYQMILALGRERNLESEKENKKEDDDDDKNLGYRYCGQ